MRTVHMLAVGHREIMLEGATEAMGGEESSMVLPSYKSYELQLTTCKAGCAHWYNNGTTITG